MHVVFHFRRIKFFILFFFCLHDRLIFHAKIFFLPFFFLFSKKMKNWSLKLQQFLCKVFSELYLWGQNCSKGYHILTHFINIFRLFWGIIITEVLSMSVRGREFYLCLLESTWEVNMQDSYWGREVSAWKIKTHKEKIITAGFISY